MSPNIFPQFWCLSFLTKVSFNFFIFYRKLFNSGVVISGSFRDRFDNLLIDFNNHIFEDVNLKMWRINAAVLELQQ